jgi:hypothetical protein
MSALPQVIQPTHSLTPVRLLPVLASVTNDTPLTRVSLAFIAHRIDLSLRFGHPLRELSMDSGWRCAVFLPGALFCRTHWACFDDSSVRWQLMVLQACTPWDGMRRIAGIQPGAQDVQTVLQQIDTIEALGIDPVAVSPAYWRTLGERLAARRPLPAYIDEQHAAYGAGEVRP